MKRGQRRWIFIGGFLVSLIILAIWMARKEEGIIDASKMTDKEIQRRLDIREGGTIDPRYPGGYSESVLKKRQQIFYELVKVQDNYRNQDPYNTQKQQDAYKEIAKKFGITESEVRKIAVEGAQKKWPQPELR